MAEAVRPLILFVPGELHIFRASAAYHALALARDFDLVMMVGEHFRGDSFLERFLSLCPVKEICYFSVKGNIWRRHRQLVRLLRDLTKRWRPAALYQHAFVYPHNLYARFFVQTASPGAKNFVFQAAMTAPDLDSLASNLAAGEAFRFAQRRGIPSSLAVPAYRMHFRCWSFLSYQLLPLLFTGHALPVPYDLIAARRRPGSTSVPDAYLVYGQVDQDNLSREYGSLPYRIVRNPITDVGGALDATMYGAKEAAPRIVVLPSQDWVNEEIAAAPQRKEAIVTRHADIWSAALARLLARYPGRCLLWKPHPVHHDDPVMRSIVERVRRDIPGLLVADGNQSAEALMVESEIVVSDVSTVLWWASMHPGLTAISLDLWNGVGGDSLKGRPGIHYVSAVEQLDALETRYPSGAAIMAAPSVSDTVMALIA
jgi:hypothetical protein